VYIFAALAQVDLFIESSGRRRAYNERCTERLKRATQDLHVRARIYRTKIKKRSSGAQGRVGAPIDYRGPQEL